MTTLTIPRSPSDPTNHIAQDRLQAVLLYLPAYGLPLPTVVDGSADPTTLTWTPDLTAQEEANARRVIRLSGVLRMTPAELANIEDDVQIGIAYVQEPAPTQQQTITSLKALWRVMAAILKD